MRSEEPDVDGELCSADENLCIALSQQVSLVELRYNNEDYFRFKHLYSMDIYKTWQPIKKASLDLHVNS